MLWLVIAIAGLAGVWFTRSRGGIFGAAVACGVFVTMALMLGKRRDTRWFAPALIAIPLMGLAIGALAPITNCASTGRKPFCPAKPNWST